MKCSVCKKTMKVIDKDIEEDYTLVSWNCSKCMVTVTQFKEEGDEGV